MEMTSLPVRLLCLALILCPAHLIPPLDAAQTFTVATYNLENYLLAPTGNRPAKPPEAKARAKQILLAVNADIFALQEIGGTAALLELQQSLHNVGLHYPYHDLVTGSDTNIQLALLSRFPIVRRLPHTNDSFLLFGQRFRVSRGFAEITVQVRPGYAVTLFNAHLKSRRQVPYADETELREEEALLLRQKIDHRLAADRGANIIVLGDFNDTRDSRTVRIIRGRGKNALVDTRPAERNGDNAWNPDSRTEPRNVTWTHYYGKEDSYSRLDYLFLSPGLAREWDRAGTFIPSIPNWGLASDHRPIIARFIAEDR